MEHAWEWTHRHGGIILEQLKKLGASCDWDRTRFTMEDDLSDAVIDTFINLHEKGLIYKGHRMVNWDPSALTAVSDEEVNHKEVNSKLYYIKYFVVDDNDHPVLSGHPSLKKGGELTSDQTLDQGTSSPPEKRESQQGEGVWLTIATTRPETILGDTAICINPNDERFKHLHGKRAIVPMVERSVPIILDDYVDMEFGTGCLKVTPAHDENDYNLGQKHDLETIDILNPDGTMSEAAQFYVGEDSALVRKKIAKDLEASGHLVKVEDYMNKVGYSERTDAVIEPRLSEQWFVSMKKLAEPALEHVLNGNVKFHPSKSINTYRHWMENVRDWCISRQLWWGQRIPVWYDPEGNYEVAKSSEEAFKKFNSTFSDFRFQISDLKQDEDVVDTWFSSWLWPISVFDGFKDPDNADINYYYPTNDLVTAPEILFFWVARMIMAGEEFRGEIPFRNVYLTGIVRDKQRRKMSKSLGNSPDPIALMEKYGADGVRVGMLLSSPAGNDLLFDEKLCEQGRNFANKIWNSFRLIKGWEVDADLEQPQEASVAIEWFNSRFNKELETLNGHYDKFRLSDALMTTYKLVWDDFCSWYLEIVKPGSPTPQDGERTAPRIDAVTYKATVDILEKLLKILHPWTPFISEEIWGHMGEHGRDERMIVSPWPEAGTVDTELLSGFAIAEKAVMEIRRIRNEKQISPKEDLTLLVKGDLNDRFAPVIGKLAGLESVKTVSDAPTASAGFVTKGIEFFIPLEGLIDSSEEKEKLKKELDYTRGFLATVQKKLGNERFVSGAPDQVIEAEKNKQADAEAKIKALVEQLAVL